MTDGGNSFHGGGGFSPQPEIKSMLSQPAVSTKNLEQGNKKSAKKKQKPSGKQDAQRAIEQLRQKNNQELLNILEEEQRSEAERESKLREISDENERKRLEKIFGIERAKASERIVNASSEHERLLNKEMKRLGLL